MLWLNWYHPHGYPTFKTGIRVRYQWKLRAVDSFIPNWQNATSPLEHRGLLRGSVLKASHTQSRIPMLAQRLSSATSSFWIPHFGRMTWSRPLQKHEITTFAFSATSVRYRTWASHERFRMWWWRLGLITATRCCREHYNTTSRNCSTFRTVLLCATWNTHSKPLLATGNALAPGATSHDMNKISLLIFKNLQNKKPVSALPVDSLRTRSKKTFFVDYIGQVSIRQQPRELQDIPHLKSGTDWLWTLAVHLNSVSSKNLWTKLFTAIFWCYEHFFS